MNCTPERLFKIETIIGATLLTFFTWVVVSMFSIKSAVAVIQSEQVIDKQVNEEVREMRDLVIRIDSNVNYIREDLASRNETK